MLGKPKWWKWPILIAIIAFGRTCASWGHAMQNPWTHPEPTLWDSIAGGVFIGGGWVLIIFGTAQFLWWAWMDIQKQIKPAEQPPSKLKLWIIKPRLESELWQDTDATAQAFVVAAETEFRARQLITESGWWGLGKKHDTEYGAEGSAAWNKEHATCKEIKPEMAEIIMRSRSAKKGS